MGILDRLWAIAANGEIYATSSNPEGKWSRYPIAFVDPYTPHAGAVISSNGKFAWPIRPKEVGTDILNLQITSPPIIGYPLSWEIVKEGLETSKKVVIEFYERVMNGKINERAKKELLKGKCLVAIGGDGQIYELRPSVIDDSLLFAISSSMAEKLIIGKNMYKLRGKRQNWAILLYGGKMYLTYLPQLHYLRHYVECRGLVEQCNSLEYGLPEDALKHWSTVKFVVTKGKLYIQTASIGDRRQKPVGKVTRIIHYSSGETKFTEMEIVTTNGSRYVALMRHCDNGMMYPLVFLRIVD